LRLPAVADLLRLAAGRRGSEDAPEQHVGELRRVDGSFELEPLDDKA
jgi:hypothetical protein